MTALVSTPTDPDTPRIGRVHDIDSHEMLPVGMWREAFGAGAGAIADLECGVFDLMAENTLNRADIVADVMAIDKESVWNVKGPGAPSAFDMTRRPEVLDMMGIDRQLVFPTFALFALMLDVLPNAAQRLRFDPTIDIDRHAIAREAILGHNKWAARITRESNDRIRPVALLMTNSVEMMIEDTKTALADGVRAVMMSISSPPANTSPADEALDPFWALLAEANVPATAHLGLDTAVFDSLMWNANVEVFTPSGNSSAEFPLEPWTASTIHVASENFLTSMILGGVFERHPTLRFGAIEVGASWVGPLAERLDLWATEFGKRLGSVLSMKPSEYLARNVRVTPFHFEDVASYFERYPHLADVYAYSSDFPHREGGRKSKLTFYKKLENCSDEVLTKFFVTNGDLLLPD